MTAPVDQPIHVLQIAGRPIGGLRKHVHSILNGLDSERFIQSYTYSTTAQDEHFKREIGPLRTRLVGDVPLCIHTKPHPNDLLNLVKLISYCRKNRVDIVHGHGAKGGMYARIVAFVCRVPAFYTPHGGVAHNMFGYWEDKLYTFVEKQLARFTHCYIFESRYTAESFQSKVGKLNRPWIVNYNGIACSAKSPAQLAKPSDAPHEINIGVFAMLRKEKGQIHLINAVASIAKAEQANIRLHIFGDGPDRIALENRVQELNIPDRVRFYGDVADPEPEMAKMDIIAIPSLFESFGYVGLEAMSLGKPVIASAVGGLLEIFDQQNACLVPPSDEMALSNAIIQCIQNPKILNEMVLRGRESCEAKFSLFKMINVLSNQYQSATLP